jgi:excisionase family DNA binding protein
MVDTFTTKTTEAPASALLTVHDVAERLRCSDRTVRRMVDAGMMPRPVRVCALLRWRPEIVEEWIAAGCPRSPRGTRR